MKKDKKIKELKAQIADTKFYLGMTNHAMCGYYPAPHHELEVERLSVKLHKLLDELAELESDE